MASVQQLAKFKSQFSKPEQWLQFQTFIEQYKVRGNADEIWLQWEIHNLQAQADHHAWQAYDARFVAPELLAGSSIFQ